MLYTALGFFALAAAFGLYLLTCVLSDTKTPKSIALLHGLCAVTGVVLLIVYLYLYQSGPIATLVLFILAALGGLTLITRDLRGQPLPKWLALGHGLTAVIAFVLLIVFIFTK